MEAVAGGRGGVLLDRDGTLIRDTGYLTLVEQIEVLPRVPEALRLLQRHGLARTVLTNQSAVARGLLSERDLSEIHREMERRLAEAGAFLDAIYYCPHHPTEGRVPYRMACACRKPNTGLAIRAAVDLDLDLGHSYVVGDQWTDMELASRIGAKGFLISGGGEAGPRWANAIVVRDLLEASEKIIEDFHGKR